MWSAYDLVMLFAALVAALLLLSDVRDEALRACKPFLLRLLENAGALTKEDYATRANLGHATAHHDALRGASAAGAFARGVAAEQSQAHAQPTLSAGAWGERTAPPLSIVAPVPQVAASASPPTGSSYGTPGAVPSPTSATAAPSPAPAAATPTASPSPSIEAAGAATGSAVTSSTTSTTSRSGSGIGSTLSPPTATEAAAAAAERKRRSSAKGTAVNGTNAAAAPSVTQSQSTSSSSTVPLDADRDEAEAHSHGQSEVSRSSASRSQSRKQGAQQAQPQASQAQAPSQPAAVAAGTWPPPPPPIQNAGAATAAPALAVAPLAQPTQVESLQTAVPISVVVPVSPLPAIVAAALTAQATIPSATAATMPVAMSAAVAEPLDISQTAPHDGQGREVSVSRRGPGGVAGGQGAGAGAGENAYVAWLAAQQTAATPISPQAVPLIAGHPLTSLTVLRTSDCGVAVEEYFTPSGEKIAWRRGNIWDSDFIYTLTQGLELMKYGSWGRPHIRKIRFVLAADGGGGASGGASGAAASASGPGAGSLSGVRSSQLCLDWGSGSIPLTEVLRVEKGKQTPVLRRYAKDAAVPPQSCFSLLTARRSLDLQVLSTKTLRMQEKRDLLAFGLAEVTGTRLAEDGSPLPVPALRPGNPLRDEHGLHGGQSALPMPHQKILEAIRAQREGGGRGAGGIVPFVQGGVLGNGIMGTAAATAAGSKPGSGTGTAAAGAGVSQLAAASAREKEYSLSTQLSRSQAPYAFASSLPGTPASTVHNLRAQQSSPGVPRQSVTMPYAGAGAGVTPQQLTQQQQQQLALQQAALLQGRGSMLIGAQPIGPYNQTLLQQQHQLQLQQLQQLQQRQLLLAQAQVAQGGVLVGGLSPQAVANGADLSGALLPPPSFAPLSPTSASALGLSGATVGSGSDPMQQSSLDQMLLRNSIILGQQQLHMHQLSQQQQQQQQQQQLQPQR